MCICTYEVGEALADYLSAFTVRFSEMLDLTAAGKPSTCGPEDWVLCQLESFQGQSLSAF